MPQGTRVAKCVKDVKAKGENVNAYAVCQKATGQSYATGKPIMKSHMPPGVEQSPKGDLGEHAQREMRAVFKRPIKGAGKDVLASKALPFTREKMVCDYAQHDEVV